MSAHDLAVARKVHHVNDVWIGYADGALGLHREHNTVVDGSSSMVKVYEYCPSKTQVTRTQVE